MIGAALLEPDGTSGRARASFAALKASRGLDIECISREVLAGDPRLRDLLVVSTCVRGQAGSTSDVDLIAIVAPGAGGAAEFRESRGCGDVRVGVTYLPEATLHRELALLDEWPDEPAGAAAFIEPALRRFTLSWRDIERAVNGFSFSNGARYAGHLGPLCRWWAARALCRSDFARAAVGLCEAARMPGVGAAYRRIAFLSLVEWLLAMCGDVQGNNKWLLERWQRVVPPPFLAAVQHELAAYYRLQRSGGRPSAAAGAAILHEVRSLIADGPYGPEDTCLSSKPGLRTAEAVPGALAISATGGPAWMVAESAWRRLQGRCVLSGRWSADDARAALHLMHDGLMSCRIGRL